MADAMNESIHSLPAVLDLAAAETLLGVLRDRLRDGTSLRLDASAVQTLTFPCLQVLLAAMRDGRVTIENASADFIQTFQDLGLEWQTSIDANAAAAASQATASATSQESFAGSEAGEQRSATKRILTIDDSKTIRDMLMLTLSAAGFEVLQAVDGQDGIEVLGDQHVDVVITDINMPRMNGYEVIRQLRSNAAHRSIPILVLTTESDADKMNVAREAGATGWMVKPFDPERLIATVNRVAP